MSLKPKPTSACTDAVLIDRWQKGDESAFDALYRKYVIQLLRTACQKTGDMETAKELVQDVFIEVFEQRDRLRICQSLKGYLYTAVKNKVFNHYRQECIRKKYQQHLHDYGMFSVNDASLHVENNELTHLITQYIQKLPPKCRTVFLLSREEHLSHREIAGRLNISVNTVEQHMRKALRMLRGSLSEYLKTLQ